MKQGLYCGVVKNLIFLGTAVWQEFLYYGMTSEGLAIHSWKFNLVWYHQFWHLWSDGDMITHLLGLNMSTCYPSELRTLCYSLLTSWVSCLRHISQGWIIHLNDTYTYIYIIYIIIYTLSCICFSRWTSHRQSDFVHHSATTSPAQPILYGSAPNWARWCPPGCFSTWQPLAAARCANLPLVYGN